MFADYSKDAYRALSSDAPFVYRRWVTCQPSELSTLNFCASHDDKWLADQIESEANRHHKAVMIEKDMMPTKQDVLADGIIYSHLRRDWSRDEDPRNNPSTNSLDFGLAMRNPIAHAFGFLYCAASWS